MKRLPNSVRKPLTQSQNIGWNYCIIRLNCSLVGRGNGARKVRYRAPFVAGICITLNCWGKDKGKVVIRGLKLIGKQSAAMVLTRRDHSSDIRLRYDYTGISELWWFACGEYHSDLLLMGIIYRWPSFTCSAIFRPSQPAIWTHLDTLRMLAKTWVNQVIWMKCNALPWNACSCCPKQINRCPCMFSSCFKPNCVLLIFWAVYFSGTSINHAVTISCAYFQW